MRVKRGVAARKRHKKVLNATKGYRMTKSKLFRVAHEAYMHAGQYSFNDRRKRGEEFRKLWIARINAAVRKEGLSYSKFQNNLRQKDVQLNRHALAELAVNYPETFSKIVEFAKA